MVAGSRQVRSITFLRGHMDRVVAQEAQEEPLVVAALVAELLQEAARVAALRVAEQVEGKHFHKT